MIFDGGINQRAVACIQIAVRGRQPALSATGHTAKRGAPLGVMVPGTRAGMRRACASLHRGAQERPTRLGSQQRGNGQNGQESNGKVHGFDWEP